MRGDNPSSAGDQQERPRFEQWVVGFVDGEGCFSVPIFRNAKTRMGWQVQPEFVVVQGVRSASVLEDLQAFFGCGSVSTNRRSDNHREDISRYVVRRLADLRGRIIPFFEDHPLRTAKIDEFRKFSTIVELMSEGRHLRMEGLAEIAAIAETMNHRKRSRFLESSEAIRRPSLDDTRDEDMVLPL
jgi:hypothetical protein